MQQSFPLVWHSCIKESLHKNFLKPVKIHASYIDLRIHLSQRQESTTRSSPDCHSLLVLVFKVICFSNDFFSTSNSPHKHSFREQLSPNNISSADKFLAARYISHPWKNSQSLKQWHIQQYVSVQLSSLSTTNNKLPVFTWARLEHPLAPTKRIGPQQAALSAYQGRIHALIDPCSPLPLY